MSFLLLNWKTSLMGIAGLITVAVNVANHKSVTQEDMMAIMANLGLIFAKDFNVTGA